ncbi:hypothetical protein BGX31_010882, partial [Mortierella sp. GBA43]
MPAKKQPDTVDPSSGLSGSDTEYPEAKVRKLFVVDYRDGDRESIEKDVSGPHYIPEGENLDLTRKLMEKRKEAVEKQGGLDQSDDVSLRL